MHIKINQGSDQRRAVEKRLPAVTDCTFPGKGINFGVSWIFLPFAGFCAS
jgi:hypothetical protein